LIDRYSFISLYGQSVVYPEQSRGAKPLSPISTMCGRFTLSANAARLQEFFPLFEIPETTPRYNIAPTQQVLALRQEEGGKPRACWLRWGLIPSWAKDKKIGASLINARADTVASKPAFRAAFKRRRCLILADGFYEWRKAEKASKQPFHMRLNDGQPFAFAGLWEVWHGEDKAIESSAIITTDANDVVRPLHQRMPVILGAPDYTRWLDPTHADTGLLQEMLRPYPHEQMTATRVCPYVNNARHEGAECLALFQNVVN
jgi:putative SOS response-associated peptidase YedK